MEKLGKLIGIVAVSATIISSMVMAQNSETKSAELQVLDRFIGSWEETVVHKPALWTPEKRTTTISGTRRWILDNHMVENKGVWSPDDKQFLHLMTYDTKRREYRQWFYDRDSLVPMESKGTWDAAAQSLTFTGTLEDGVQTTTQEKFENHDTITWTFIAKDRSGKVVLEMEAKCLRKK